MSSRRSTRGSKRQRSDDDDAEPAAASEGAGDRQPVAATGAPATGGEQATNPRRKRQRTAKGAGAGAGAGASSDDGKRAPCVICLEPLPVKMTRAARASVEDMPTCGHRFHAACVLALQRAGVNNACPLCRAAMPESAWTMVEDAHTLRVRAEYGKVDGATFRMLVQARVQKLRDAIARDPQHGRALNDLAYALEDQGKFKEAEPLYRRFLEVAKKDSGGKPHVDVATSMCNLGNNLAQQGKDDEAEALLLQSIEMRKELFGEEDPRVGVPINNLASLYYKQHRYAEAEVMYTQALELAKKEHGDTPHEHVSCGLMNLASAKASQDKFDEAVALLREALEIDKKVFGDEHPDVAKSLFNLANTLRCQGSESAEAKRLGKQALAVAEKALGPDHPETKMYRKYWGDE